MARPKKTEAPDLAQRLSLTAGAIERLTCPPGKQQAFLRDSEAPGLRVRITAAGARSFVYEAKLNRQTIRRTIGDVKLWTVEQARAEARRLAVLLDSGTDPRELERQQQAAQAAAQAKEAARAVAAAEAWQTYLEERRPFWGCRHYDEHLRMSKAGGEPAKNRPKTTTQAGPLHPLLSIPLRELTTERVEQWAAEQANTRPTVARLAWRMLKAFLNWCAEHPTYSQALTSTNPAKTRKAREALGRPKAKQDALQREQLPAWFDAVRKLHSPVVAVYLQAVLLTGARPGEVLAMRWEDLNLQWRGLTIRDKVEGERVIPLTPYVRALLMELPRRNAWVFASPRSDREGQHMTRLDPMHTAACKVAGIEGLTLHGLRRSFKSLTEWLDIPAGVVAQLMGHKPSATAEKHYTVRPLDLLRLHHERIEAWILEQAGIAFDRAAEPGRLRVVA
jgi:integrase